MCTVNKQPAPLLHPLRPTTYKTMANPCSSPPFPGKWEEVGSLTQNAQAHRHQGETGLTSQVPDSCVLLCRFSSWPLGQHTEAPELVVLTPGVFPPSS